VIYAVRLELEVTVGEGEHASAYGARLGERIRQLEDATVLLARVLFRGRRGPFHGIATVSASVQARDQGRALAAALRVLRAAAGEDATAWDVGRAKVTVRPERRALSCDEAGDQAR
jgi:hypothetical protein